MTDETVECFNCGRANPEWAQVCRSCGVPLRHGQTRVAPTGRFPTDRDSLVSIGAVIGTILAAVVLGVFVSGLNPSDPSLALATPTPSPSVEPSIDASGPVTPTDTPAPTPSPTPALPGTLVFGSELDANRQVVTPVETFTPPVNFAYSVTLPDAFGANAIENEIAKVDDGVERIVLARQAVPVDPAATNFGFVIGTAGDFLGPWEPGDFIWRVYVGGTLVAEGTFRYAEG